MAKKILMLGVTLIMSLGLLTGCKDGQETRIREDYLAFMNSQGENEMTLKDIKILDNYGTYNEAVVVRINRGAYEVVTTIQVGSVEFKFNNTNTPLVWKDGQFFELSVAYYKGLLTQNNLEALAKKVNN